MNSEVTKNFRLTIKDTTPTTSGGGPTNKKRGKKTTDTNYIFTCRNCNAGISIPGGGGKDFVNMGQGSTDNILSLHLMTCEKYLLTPEKGATAI